MEDIWFSKFRCSVCNGSGFSSDILNYKIDDKNIAMLLMMPIIELYSWATRNNYDDIVIKLQPFINIGISDVSFIINGLDNDASVFEFKCNKFLSIFPNGLVTSCDAMREFEQKIDIEKVFQNTVHPDYVRSCIDVCSKCKYLAVCKGGCPPLMYRYMLYAPNLLNEYCEYRVKIRQYVKEVVKT